MEINGTTYTLDQLKDKLLKQHEMFFYENVESGSHEDTLDKDPIATTNPNLHMRYDSSQVVVRGENEIFNRRYVFLGRVGTRIYSSRQRFFHNEEDEEFDEIP